RTQRVTARVLAIAVLAAIGLGMSAQRAVAQTKNPLAPQLVRNIDEPGFNPYQHSQNTLTSGCNCSATVVFDLPANEVVVVEHASVTGACVAGGAVQAFLRCSTTQDATQEVNHALVLVPEGSVNGFTFYSASQPVKCYASAPGSLSLHVQTGALGQTQHTWVM